MLVGMQQYFTGVARAESPASLDPGSENPSQDTRLGPSHFGPTTNARKQVGNSETRA